MPEIDRQQGAGRRVAFRADAAFARPAIYEALEQRDVDYAIRMPANKTLELAVEDILFRPPGRPSCKPLVRYKSFRYQAKSWTTARRIDAQFPVDGQWRPCDDGRRGRWSRGPRHTGGLRRSGSKAPGATALAWHGPSTEPGIMSWK